MPNSDTNIENKFPQRELLHGGGPFNAQVWIIRDVDGKTRIEKDFSKCSFIVRNTIGRFLIRREVFFLKKLEHTGLVPTNARRVGSFTLTEDFCKGSTLRDFYPDPKKPKGMPPASKSLEALKSGVRHEFQRCHVAHLDLHNARNVIITPEGKPIIIDWQSAVSTRFVPFPFNRFLHYIDTQGVRKFECKFHPERLSAKEARSMRFFSFIHKYFWIPRMRFSNSEGSGRKNSYSARERLRAVAQLCRLPNLPTALFDSGAGYVLATRCELQQANTATTFSAGSFVAVCLAELMAYIFGLLDNDIVGLEEDKNIAPQRPLPSGRISITAVRLARAFVAVISVATLASAIMFTRAEQARLITACACAVALLALIMIYNRTKSKFRVFGYFSMGLCRGSAVLIGAIPFMQNTSALLPICILGGGIALYISAITYLAADEHKAHAALGFDRYILGLTALIPAVATPIAFGWTSVKMLVPAVCCVVTFIVWCARVHKLGSIHTPEIRRKTIGQIISALLLLQVGFVAIEKSAWPLIAIALVAKFAICNKARNISGS